YQPANLTWHSWAESNQLVSWEFAWPGNLAALVSPQLTDPAACFSDSYELIRELKVALTAPLWFVPFNSVPVTFDLVWVPRPVAVVFGALKLVRDIIA